MEYSADDIVLVEFDESVRTRPSIYFDASVGSPVFATAVLESVASHALHPAAVVASERHTLRSTVDVVGDRSFAITIHCPQDLSAGPLLGYFDSLLTPRWMSLAATAAISERTVVEVWSEGVGFRQDLAALRPQAPPERYNAPVGSGLRMATHLDSTHVGPNFAFPTSLQGLDLHGPYCDQSFGVGAVVFRDLREVTYS